jgi:hypothetical protein
MTKACFSFFTIFIAVIICTKLVSAQTELIQNGTFEGTFNASGVANGWYDNSSWAPVTLVYSSSVPGSGGVGKCQKVDVTTYSGGSAQLIQNLVVSIPRYHTAHLSLSLKGSMSAGVEIQLRKQTSPYTTFISKTFSVTNSWVSFNYDAMMPDDEEDMAMVICLTGTGTVFLDDIHLSDLGETSINPYAVLTPPTSPVPSTLFGQHTHNHFYPAITWPKVGFKVLRFWDSKTSWPLLEPTKGVWDWTRMDDLVNRAVASNVQVLFTMALTPTWASARPNESNAYSVNDSSAMGWAAEASNIADWTNYVTKVATRYKGKIHYYEMWNEPNNNLMPLSFFSGTYAKLAQLCFEAFRAIKAIDPTATVIGPSVVANSAYLDNFLAAGGLGTFDKVGYHFYTGYHSSSPWGRAPERSIAEVFRVKEVMKKYGIADLGIWNTESGWYSESFLDPSTQPVNGVPSVWVPLSEQGDLIARLYLFQFAQGIETACFYAWDNGDMGLIETDGSEKPGVQAVRSIQSWMISNRMESLYLDNDENWIADLSQPDGKKFEDHLARIQYLCFRYPLVGRREFGYFIR